MNCKALILKTLQSTLNGPKQHQDWLVVEEKVKSHLQEEEIIVDTVLTTAEVDVHRETVAQEDVLLAKEVQEDAHQETEVLTPEEDLQEDLQDDHQEGIHQEDTEMIDEMIETEEMTEKEEMIEEKIEEKEEDLHLLLNVALAHR